MRRAVGDGHESAMRMGLLERCQHAVGQKHAPKHRGLVSNKLFLKLTYYKIKVFNAWLKNTLIFLLSHF
jgi:hypothetical protein